MAEDIYGNKDLWKFTVLFWRKELGSARCNYRKPIRRKSRVLGREKPFQLNRCIHDETKNYIRSRKIFPATKKLYWDSKISGQIDCVKRNDTFHHAFLQLHGAHALWTSYALLLNFLRPKFFVKYPVGIGCLVASKLTGLNRILLVMLKTT